MEVSTTPAPAGLEADSAPHDDAGVWRRVLIAGGAVLALASLGVGAYLFALSRGNDIEQARALGVRVGLEHGAADGRRAGYRKGLRMGQKAGFGESYADAYRKAYREQFELTNLKPPSQIIVPAPGAER
ncbi:MAG: hypothetical protein QOI10_170 [Solirubrobacterales bacterium]|jgi:hypothetical protein|nr:hypothetical protein [Solirubrobacterales bacterium]